MRGTYHDDEEQDDDFDTAKSVHSMDADLGHECMNERDDDDDTNGNSALLPGGGSEASRDPDVGCEDDAAAGSEP